MEIANRASRSKLKKTVIEDTNRLDLRLISKETLKTEGGVLLGFRNSTLIYQLRVFSDHLKLTSHNQIISFERMACHFGGYRYWLRCPGCQRRVSVLNEFSGAYLCAPCHGLTYESQRERPMRRHKRAICKIGGKVGGAPLFSSGTKPKGMHLATFTKLQHDRYCRFQELEGLVYGVY